MYNIDKVILLSLFTLIVFLSLSVTNTFQQTKKEVEIMQMVSMERDSMLERLGQLQYEIEQSVADSSAFNELSQAKIDLRLHILSLREDRWSNWIVCKTSTRMLYDRVSRKIMEANNKLKK